jgi:hypothetical protein
MAISETEDTQKGGCAGLTGTEITGRELRAREAFEARKAIESRAVTPEQDDREILIADTPPWPMGSSRVVH